MFREGGGEGKRGGAYPGLRDLRRRRCGLRVSGVGGRVSFVERGLGGIAC